MDTGLIMVLVVALAMLVYAALSLRTLVRMRRNRASVIEADMPENLDAGHSALNFAAAKQWFAGKACGACGRAIQPLHHLGPQPGFKRRAPGAHPILTWDEVPAGSVPLIDETFVPLCAKCQIAESLKQEYPDVVTRR
jgi:hypothetical protein